MMRWDCFKLLMVCTAPLDKNKECSCALPIAELGRSYIIVTAAHSPVRAVACSGLDVARPDRQHPIGQSHDRSFGRCLGRRVVLCVPLFARVSAARPGPCGLRGPLARAKRGPPRGAGRCRLPNPGQKWHGQDLRVCRCTARARQPAGSQSTGVRDCAHPRNRRADSRRDPRAGSLLPQRQWHRAVGPSIHWRYAPRPCYRASPFLVHTFLTSVCLVRCSYHCF